MSEQNILTKTSTLIKNSATFKILTIGFLLLVLLIPASMTKSLIQERKDRRNEVVDEISSKWGNQQTISGPVLTMPYKKYFKDSEGKTRYSVKNIHCLPKRLSVKGDIKPEIRYRGIYEAVLYNADITLEGMFELPDLQELDVAAKDILWSRSFVSLGIKDMRGIKENITASVDDQNISVTPGIESKDVLESGISAKLSVPSNKQILPFRFTVNLNGSQQINFTPVGEITDVSLASTWPSPSFTGSYLPVSRKISKDGFAAVWKVLHLNRNYPQHWKDNKYQISNSSFGVKLFIATDIYQKSMRTSKYAIMFFVFTFTALFFSEVINRKRLHPIQYLLIGFALCVFYTLLIAVSEHINFNISYFLSSIATILLITGYSKSILHSKRLSITVFGVLTLLYSYMYIVLQLEDYALLMGSIGLFILLGIIMYITRKIDWYSVKFEEEKP
jgi:inner membrane protein